MKIWRNQEPKELGAHVADAPIGAQTTEQALVMFKRAMTLPEETRFHAFDGSMSNLQRAVDDYRFRGGPVEVVAEAFLEVEGLVQAIINA